jgi:hypothetical protein
VIFSDSTWYIPFVDSKIVDYTLNAGESFQRLRFPGEFFYFNMYNEDIGLYMSRDSVYYTKDGWKTINVKAEGDEIYYFDRINLFSTCILDSNNILFNRHTEKENISFIKFNFDSGEFSDYSSYKHGFDEWITLSEIEKVNDSLIFTIGRYRTGQADLKRNLFYKSNDSGLTWDLINYDTNSVFFSYSDMDFENELHGIKIGYNKWEETFDGGYTWHKGYTQYDFARSIAEGVKFHKGFPLVASAGIYRYEEVYEELEEVEININVPTEFCYLNNSIKLDDLVEVENQIVGKDSSFSGRGVLYYDLGEKPEGYYFYPAIAKEGSHEITYSYLNHKYYNADSLLTVKKFIVNVKGELPDPIITHTGNTLTTQYEKVDWYSYPDNQKLRTGLKNYSPVQDGTYYAIWTSDLGCGEVSEPYEFRLTSVQNNINKDIIITDNVIKYDSNIKDVRIFNINGQNVDIPTSSNRIDISGLLGGVYFLRYSVGHESKVMKFIND